MTVSDSWNIGVTIYGIDELKRALRQFAPDLKKEMDAEIRSALSPIVGRARSLVPQRALSGWGRGGGGEWSQRLGWDPSAVRSGMRIRQGGRRARGSAVKAAWRITQRDAAGSVWEVAGRRSRGSSPQGRAFIAGLDRGSGSASRGIWRAFDDLDGTQIAETAVLGAIRSAEGAYESRILSFRTF